MEFFWLMVGYVFGGIMGFSACALFTLKALQRTRKEGRHV